MGGEIGMGNTCKPMAVSFKCMTKLTTNKKKNKGKGEKEKKYSLYILYTVLHACAQLLSHIGLWE